MAEIQESRQEVTTMQKRKVRPEMPYEELIAAWVKDHGEAMMQGDAAKLIGVSRGTIYNAVSAGKLKVTPNRRVLTRSLCAYANSFPDQLT